MKAIEYYKKHLEGVKGKGDEEYKTALYGLLIDMQGEVFDIAHQRGVKGGTSMLSIFREMNDRWNAMRKWDKSLRRDGFILFWEDRMGMRLR